MKVAIEYSNDYELNILIVCIQKNTSTLRVILWNSSVRERVVKVVGFNPLAPQRSGIESPPGTLDYFN
jgi:hypothetical protein